MVQIVTFLLMSAVVFLGFAQSFFLGFYVSNEGFQSMLESLMSMLRFTTGDVDYEALNRTNTVLAPLLYTLSLFVLGFVWTSLLLAIVINAYYDEVNDVRLPPPLRRAPPHVPPLLPPASRAPYPPPSPPIPLPSSSPPGSCSIHRSCCSLLAARLPPPWFAAGRRGISARAVRALAPCRRRAWPSRCHPTGMSCRHINGLAARPAVTRASHPARRLLASSICPALRNACTLAASMLVSTAATRSRGGERLSLMQEGAFEFDKDFPNFSIGNPLLRKHKEWDEAAMTGANDSPFLTPDLYNRQAPPLPPTPSSALEASSQFESAATTCLTQSLHLCLHRSSPT